MKRNLVMQFDNEKLNDLNIKVNKKLVIVFMYVATTVVRIFSCGETK